jgi:hypothetical protein
VAADPESHTGGFLSRMLTAHSGHRDMKSLPKPKSAKAKSIKKN